EAALFLDDEVIESGGAVGVRLDGVEVLPCVSQGAAPFGPELTITSADGHIIHELAGRPALTKLREIIRDLPLHQRAVLNDEGLLVGIVVDGGKPEYVQGDFLVRGLLGADPSEGSVAVGTPVCAGQVVRLHARDAGSADRDLREALSLHVEALGGDPPAGALVFTCNGRGRGLFGVADHDAEVVEEAFAGAPAAGFFAAGERWAWIWPTAPRRSGWSRTPAPSTCSWPTRRCPARAGSRTTASTRSTACSTSTCALRSCSPGCSACRWSSEDRGTWSSSRRCRASRRPRASRSTRRRSSGCAGSRRACGRTSTARASACRRSSRASSATPACSTSPARPFRPMSGPARPATWPTRSCGRSSATSPRSTSRRWACGRARRWPAWRPNCPRAWPAASAQARSPERSGRGRPTSARQAAGCCRCAELGGVVAMGRVCVAALRRGVLVAVGVRVVVRARRGAVAVRAIAVAAARLSRDGLEDLGGQVRAVGGVGRRRLDADNDLLVVELLEEDPGRLADGRVDALVEEGLDVGRRDAGAQPRPQVDGVRLAKRNDRDVEHDAVGHHDLLLAALEHGVEAAERADPALDGPRQAAA